MKKVRIIIDLEARDEITADQARNVRRGLDRTVSDVLFNQTWIKGWQVYLDTEESKQ